MVTADGSKEGAIAWISPEKNEHFSFATSSVASILIDYATPLRFDPYDLDRPACVKKAVEKITECLYKKKLHGNLHGRHEDEGPEEKGAGAL